MAAGRMQGWQFYATVREVWLVAFAMGIAEAIGVGRGSADLHCCPVRRVRVDDPAELALSLRFYPRLHSDVEHLLPLQIQRAL